MNNETKNWELVNFCEYDKYATQAYCSIHDVDESLNLGDITQVDETKLSDFNMICGGSPCFIAGTKVMTDGGYKNIEDIKIGDLVLSHLNRFMPVVKIGGENAQRIFSLCVQGFLKTECTDYHPFYCKKSRDSVPEKIKLKDIQKGYYIGSHINDRKENKYNLSNEDCWILGRYVADGHVRKYKRKGRKNSYQYQLILSIGDSKIGDLEKNVLNRHYSCYPHSQSTHRVVFSSMELVDFIIKHNFGRKAEDKTIPNFMLDLPIDKLQSFLCGYMDGDGCSIEYIHQATTISKELAMMLCLVIQKVYRVGCRIYHDKRPKTSIIAGRVVNQKDTYMIRFMVDSQKQAWFIENNIVWYPVKEVKKTEKVMDVYNIEVKEDHTYTANNMITFNCQDFSVAGKQNGSVWACNDCHGEHEELFEWNPLTVHWSQRHKCPRCGSENINKSRSSLLVEYLRVIRYNKPNFGIYENVKNIVGKKFKDTFKMFTDELEEYGYSVYWKVLNAKDYGVPQNRERVYLIFIKQELDNEKFKFPESFDNGIRLKDVLEPEVDEKYYISDEKVKKFIGNLQIDLSKDNLNSPKFLGNINRPDFGTGYAGGVWDKNCISPTLTTMQGGGRQPNIVCGIDKSINNPSIIENANCITSREDRGISNRKSEGTAVIECIGNVNPSGNGMNGNVFSDEGLAPTLTTNKGEGSKIFLEKLIRIRKLIPLETFRLMGFSDEDFYKAMIGYSKVAKDFIDNHPYLIGKTIADEATTIQGISNSQLYKMSGNSIVVDVLYYIYVELYKAMPYLFDDLKLSSFFSGVGAFEVALDRLYEGINTGNFTRPQVE